MQSWVEAAVAAGGLGELDCAEYFQPLVPSLRPVLADRYKAVAEDAKKSNHLREAALLLALAEQYINEELIDEAIEAAGSALSAFNKLGESVAAADAMRVLVDAHRAESFNASSVRPEEAERLAAEALGRAEVAGDLYGQVVANLALAEMESFELASDVRLSEACRRAEAAVAMAQELKDTTLEGQALLVWANTLHAQCRPKDLMVTAKRALDVYKGLGDEVGAARARQAVGLAYTLLEDHNKAAASLRRALPVFQAGGLKNDEFLALFSLAQLYLLQKQPVRAHAVAKRLLWLASRPNGRRAAMQDAAALHILSESLVAQGRGSEAVDEVTELLGIHQRQLVSDFKPRCLLMQVLSHLQFAIGAKDAAIETVQSALHFSRAAGAVRLELGLLRASSRMNLSLKKPKEAVKDLQQALVVTRAMKQPARQAVVLMEASMAQLHVAADSADNSTFMAAQRAAEEFAEEARGLCRKAGHTAGEGGALLILARCRHARGGKAGYMAATILAREALGLLRTAGEAHGQGAALELLANLALEGESAEKARSAAIERLCFWSDLGARRAAAAAQCTLARLLLQQGEPESALVTAEEARTASVAIGDTHTEALALLALTQSKLRTFSSGWPESAIACGVLETSQSAIDAAFSCGDVGLLAAATMWRAHVLAATGRVEEAVAAANKAAALCHEIADVSGENTAKQLALDLEQGKALLEVSKPLLLLGRTDSSLKWTGTMPAQHMSATA